MYRVENSADILQKYGKLYWPQMFCLSIGMVIYAIAMGQSSFSRREACTTSG